MKIIPAINMMAARSHNPSDAQDTEYIISANAASKDRIRPIMNIHK